MGTKHLWTKGTVSTMGTKGTMSAKGTMGTMSACFLGCESGAQWVVVGGCTMAIAVDETRRCATGMALLTTAGASEATWVLQVWVHEALSLPTAPAAAAPRAHSQTAQQIAPRRTIGTARARERTYRRRHLPRPQPPVARSRPVQHNMTRRNTVPPCAAVALHRVTHCLPRLHRERIGCCNRSAYGTCSRRCAPRGGGWRKPRSSQLRFIVCTQHNMQQYSAACCNISRSVMQHHRAPAHIARRPWAQRGRDVHRSKVGTQPSC